MTTASLTNFQLLPFLLFSMFVSATLVASVLVATQALAVNQVVTVGRNGAKQFSPNNIQAAIGDTIEFQYVAGMHSVTQST